MSSSQRGSTAVRRVPSAVVRPGSDAAGGAITIYGCGPDEAALFEELAPRYGVRARITAAAVSEATAALARGTGWVSVGHRSPVSRATLVALRSAGVHHVSTRSIGCNHIDVGAADALGITVETVAYSPDSVADYTLMLILMLLRDARSVLRRVDDQDYRLSSTRGRELRDLTVGVVGTGRIGTAVVARLRGFGCRVLTHDSCPRPGADHVALDELLQRSDVITLHTPLTEDTHHLLGRRRIAALRPGAVVVNTARGALIDTAALVDALEDGALGGAAVDVVEGEEGIFYSDCRNRDVGGLLPRLQAIPHVIVSPHTAFHTDHALRDVVENTLISCARHERERHG